MKTYKWTVEFEVDEIWVADGFNLDQDLAIAMLDSTLPYARPNETSAKVVSAPTEHDIKKAQL